MTYCCAWTDESAAYVIADAAVTRPSTSPIEDTTSFGEATSFDGGKLVEETALKVIQIQNTAAAFAGNSATGRAVLEVYGEVLRSGQTTLVALETAMRSAQPIDRNRKAQLLVVGHDDDGPFVLLGDAVTGLIRRTTEAAQIGSIKDWHKRATQAILTAHRASASEGARISPSRTLAHALAIAQSYGSFDYLMDIGVGGAFSGVAVTETGVVWQPDMLYCFAGDLTDMSDCVLVVARHSTLVTVSTEDTRVFGDTLSEPDPALHQSAAMQAHSVLESLAFDFVVLLNPSQRVVLVVEMQKSRTHDALRLEPMTDDDGIRRGFWMEISSSLIQQVRSRILLRDGTVPSDLSFKSIGFRQPGCKRRRGREIRISGFVG